MTNAILFYTMIFGLMLLHHYSACLARKHNYSRRTLSILKGTGLLLFIIPGLLFACLCYT